MKRKILLLKISFIIMLLVAAMHTFFIIIGGPAFPATKEFAQMRELMRSIQFDTGGNVQRSMQNIMDGFNIIVSIFLITLPTLSLLMLPEISENKRALSKLTIVNLLAVLAFAGTSLVLLAIGGTILGGVVCVLLLISLF